MTSSPPSPSAASPDEAHALSASSPAAERDAVGEAAAQVARTRWSPQEITLLIGSVALITLGAFESLATTTIMPRVVTDLGAQTWFSVASGAALTAQLVAVVIAGSLSDSRGARPVLWAGIVSFNVGLVLCAVAPHVAVFVIGRLLQGLGMGLLIVPLYVLIGAIASEPHRPTFFAAFSLAWLVPALIGPAIAGWVADTFGWRIVFGAVPAIALIAVFPLLPLLRQIPPPSAEANTTGALSLTTLTSLALAGGVGVFALQLSGALSGAPMLILAVTGLVFSIYALPRLLPRGLFRARVGLASIIGVRLFLMAAFMGGTAFLPLLLVEVHGWAAKEAALVVTLGTVGWSVTAAIQARIRAEKARENLPLIGAILMAVGLSLIATLTSPSTPVFIGAAGALLMSGGAGFAHSTISVVALAVTPQHKHGKVSSWLQVADAAGSALQLAVTSVVLFAWSHLAIANQIAWTYAPAVVLAVLSALIAVFYALRGRRPVRDVTGA